jgi:hypothetical protein
MIFIDSKTYKIDSNDTVDQIIHNLKKQVAKPGFAQKFGNSTKYFVGKIHGNKFEISKTIEYGRRSFIPRISGSINAKSYGATVDMKMSVSVITELFLVIWWLILLGMSFAIAFLGYFLISVLLLLIFGIFFMVAIQTMIRSYKKERLASFHKLIEVVQSNKGFVEKPTQSAAK